MFKTMQNQDQQSPEKKRQMEQPRGSDQYAAMRQIASLMGNQAMLGMMQSQGQYQKEQSPFFDDMRKKFGPKQKTESQASPTHRSSGGTSLPDYLREKFEKKSGLPMDDVRVHYNSDKPAELGALAYTQGTDVHIGPGQEEHLEHELVHVVQQKQGRVAATSKLNDKSVNLDESLEHEADSCTFTNGHTDSATVCVTEAAPVQMCGFMELLYKLLFCCFFEEDHEENSVPTIVMNDIDYSAKGMTGPCASTALKHFGLEPSNLKIGIQSFPVAGEGTKISKWSDLNNVLNETENKVMILFIRNDSFEGLDGVAIPVNVPFHVMVAEKDSTNSKIFLYGDNNPFTELKSLFLNADQSTNHQTLEYGDKISADRKFCVTDDTTPFPPQFTVKYLKRDKLYGFKNPEDS